MKDNGTDQHRDPVSRTAGFVRILLPVCFTDCSLHVNNASIEVNENGENGIKDADSALVEDTFGVLPHLWPQDCIQIRVCILTPR